MYTFTKRMESAADRYEEEFKFFYDRDDFNTKLKAMHEAQKKSSWLSKCKELYHMMDTCGIVYEKGKDYAYYENLIKKNQCLIPDFSDVEEKVLSALYDAYMDYPSPADYMERMVNRLSFKEDGWEKDPVRLRILKQFIKYGDYLCGAKIGGRKAVIEYVKQKLDKQKVSTEKVSTEEVLSKLGDDVFVLLEQIEQMPAEEEKEKGKDHKKQKRKDCKKQLELLRLADDLATGKFRVEGSTKKALYLFAMVYGMTYYSGDPATGELLHYETDIEKNLFRDYYTNNLMRYFQKEYELNPVEYEVDPSGQGINYKNFAEMVYLYYIAKPDSECTPQEKIRLSQEMITRLNAGPHTVTGGENRDTLYFRGNFCADKLQLPEKEFEDFIRKNYNCNTTIPATPEKKASSVSPLQLEADQNSAFREYETILSELEESSIEDWNYGLWFTDVKAAEKGRETFFDRHPEIDPDGGFRKMLYAADEFLRSAVKPRGQERKISSPAKVTRASVIAAYYNNYRKEIEEEGSMSFEEVFHDFEDCVNPCLENAGYPLLSKKNFFDMLIVFSAYADMRC